MKFFIGLCLGFTVILSCSANGEEGNFFEGDMEMSPDQMAAIREQDVNGNTYASVKVNLWKTNGRADTIKYYINPIIAGVATNGINQAIADYQKYTCLRFSKYSSKPSGPHIYFTNGFGCSSLLGKLYSGNQIRLGQGCWKKGTIIHEIGHTLGFYHEQSRPDRDSYIQIIWENIQKGMKNNFRKFGTDKIDSLGTKYDYDSVMHYGKGYFGNGRITIKTLDSSKQNKNWPEKRIECYR